MTDNVVPLRQPRALDLFCGAGGATKGLQRAGFHVTGIDIKRQPRYCGNLFIQADALHLPVRLEDFDLIWAGPPCQAYTLANGKDRLGKHPRHIEIVRQLLESAARLTCIENVPPAPIRADLVLDGTMFAGLRVVRKRHFELNFRTTIALGFPSYKLVSRHGWATPTDSDNSSHTQAARAKNGLPMRDSVAYRAIAMGTPWMMTRREIGEAIPPAYAEFIGREALRQMRLAP